MSTYREQSAWGVWEQEPPNGGTLIQRLPEAPGAIAVDGRDFAVGVQWHPETDRELRLFGALTAAAAARADTRAEARAEKEAPARP